MLWLILLCSGLLNSIVYEIFFDHLLEHKSRIVKIQIDIVSSCDVNALKTNPMVSFIWVQSKTHMYCNEGLSIVRLLMFLKNQRWSSSSVINYSFTEKLDF